LKMQDWKIADRTSLPDKKLCYRRRTARRAVAVEMPPTAAQLEKQVVLQIHN